MTQEELRKSFADIFHGWELQVILDKNKRGKLRLQAGGPSPADIPLNDFLSDIIKVQRLLFEDSTLPCKAFFISHFTTTSSDLSRANLFHSCMLVCCQLPFF
jgi:hypothetical protein